MRWNSKALECQVNRKDASENEMLSQIWIVQLYLDVDCSHLNYSTPVSEEVLTAAMKVDSGHFYSYKTIANDVL